MFGNDWLQLFQVISALLLVICFTCYLTISIQKITATIFKCAPRVNSKIIPELSSQLTVIDYEPFHKYEIWKIFRFSPSR